LQSAFAVFLRRAGVFFVFVVEVFFAGVFFPDDGVVWVAPEGFCEPLAFCESEFCCVEGFVCGAVALCVGAGVPCGSVACCWPANQTGPTYTAHENVERKRTTARVIPRSQKARRPDAHSQSALPIIVRFSARGKRRFYPPRLAIASSVSAASSSPFSVRAEASTGMRKRNVVPAPSFDSNSTAPLCHCKI
jgi:hypothetical protein